MNEDLKPLDVHQEPEHPVPPQGSAEPPAEKRAGKGLELTTSAAPIQGFRVTNTTELRAFATMYARKTVRGVRWRPPGFDEAAELADTTEEYMLRIMQGMELGLPIAASVANIAFINGKMSIHSDAVPMLLSAAGYRLREWQEVDWSDLESAKAHCEIEAPDGHKFETVTYSAQEAMVAGLWDRRPEVIGKNGKPRPNDGPWFKHPKRMLQMRARGRAARDNCAHVLGGLYTDAEASDIPMRDITPEPPSPSLDDVMAQGGEAVDLAAMITQQAERDENA